MSLKLTKSAVILSTVIMLFSLENAFAKKSQREQDLDDLKIEKKELTKLREKLSKDQKDLRSLNNAQTKGMGSVEAQSTDCFTLCRPSSEGGNCPDEIFHTAHIIIGAEVKWDATKKEFVAGAQLDQAVNRYQNAVPGSTVCEQVKRALALPNWSNTSGHIECENAVNSCKYLKLPKEISNKEDEIKDDQSSISELETHIRELKDDTEDGCADCGTAYSQREPTKAESTAMVLGSIFPYFSGGMSGYLQASSQNKYYSAYSNYLSSCTTIGVPCSGPSNVSGLSSMSAYTALSGLSSMSSYTGGYAGIASYTGGYAGIASYTGGSSYTGASSIYGSLYGSTYSGGTASSIAGISGYAGYGAYSSSAYGSMYGGLYGSTYSGLSSAYTGTSQYSALYSQSLASQMLSVQSAASASQSSLLAQQQLYSAEQRYSQTQQSSGSLYGSSYGGNYYGGTYGSSYGSFYGGMYGTTTNGYSLSGVGGYNY